MGGGFVAYMIRYTEFDYKSTVDISVHHDNFKLGLSAPFLHLQILSSSRGEVEIIVYKRKLLQYTALLLQWLKTKSIFLLPTINLYTFSNATKYPTLIYTKTVDSIKGSLWLATQTPIYFAIPLWATRVVTRVGFAVYIHHWPPPLRWIVVKTYTCNRELKNGRRPRLLEVHLKILFLFTI